MKNVASERMLRSCGTASVRKSTSFNVASASNATIAKSYICHLQVVEDGSIPSFTTSDPHPFKKVTCVFVALAARRDTRLASRSGLRPFRYAHGTCLCRPRCSVGYPPFELNSPLALEVVEAGAEL